MAEYPADEVQQEEEPVINMGRFGYGGKSSLSTKDLEIKPEFSSRTPATNKLLGVEPKEEWIDKPSSTKKFDTVEELLAKPHEWLAVFRARLVTAAVKDRVISLADVKFDPERSQMITLAGRLLRALGYTVNEVTPEDTKKWAEVTRSNSLRYLQSLAGLSVTDSRYNNTDTYGAQDKERSSSQYPRTSPPSGRERRAPTPAADQVRRTTTRTQNRVNFDDCDDWDSDSNSDRRSGRQGYRTFVPMEAIPDFTGPREAPEEGIQWLKHFVYVAREAGWDNTWACETFETKMKGSAHYWFGQLSSRIQKNWAALKKEFEDEYCKMSVTQSASARYYNAIRRTDEHVLDFLHRLNTYAKAAKIDRTGGDSGYEHVRQFLSTVRDDTISDKSSQWRSRILTSWRES